jgi:hypothetical protein
LNDFDDKKKSQEHIFPKSIGGTITVWELCSRCNGHLGSFVDNPMLEFPPIETKRLLLKLPGKTGQIPNPLTDGVLGTDTNQKVQVQMKNGDHASVYLVPNIKRSKTADGHDKVTIIVDKRDEQKLPEIIEKIRTRASQPGKEAKIVTESYFEGHIEQPNIQQTLSFHSFNWARCLLKVAYELTYRKLGPKYLSDPIASHLQSLLKITTISEADLKACPIQYDIKLMSKDNVFMYLNDDPDSLFAVLYPINNKLTCFVRIFDVFQCFVVVCEDIQSYGVINGDVIHIDIPNKKTIEMDYNSFLSQIQ